MAAPARFDKYDPVSGGFRARLAADWLDADVGAVKAVRLDGNGRVVKGSGTTAATPLCRGVIALGKKRLAGEPVDVMTDGEIVEVPGLAAGTIYYTPTDATGTLTATPPGAGINMIQIGHTVEADRLVVRVHQVQGA